VDIAKLINISYKIGPNVSDYKVIEVELNNTSNYCIEFPPDYGIKIYMDENGKITEIGNNTTYIGDKPRYLQPKGNIASKRGILFSPRVSDQKIIDSIIFYAEVTGQLCNDPSIIIQRKIPFSVSP